MQSDVTLVGGTTPAAALPAAPSTAKLSAQAGDKPPVNLGVAQAQPRLTSTGQSAAITEAKIALSAEDAPTAISQGQRVLKPYGVTMLPEPPAENGGDTNEAPTDEVVEA